MTTDMVGSKQGNESGRPVEISRLLSDVFADKKWRSKLELHRVFEFWNRTVGPEIARIAQPSLIRGKVLWVRVQDTVWMQQLHLQKVLLLDKINRQLDTEKLSDLHFQLDSSLSAPPEPESGEPRPHLIDKKQEQEFDRLISTLENADLKTSLKRLWIRMHTKG